MLSKKITRRNFIRKSSLGITSMAISLQCPFVFATEKKFPSNPIDIVVPFGVGGGTDIWLRAFSVSLTSKDSLGVPVNIRNLPGAASLRGTGMASQAKPDGYNLVSFNPPSTPWAWYLHTSPFDIRDFRGISVYVREPGIIITHPNYKYRRFNQLLDAYKLGETQIIASQQVGTIWHISALLMQKRSGMAWKRYVSYKGTGDIIAAVLRKEVDVGIVTASSVIDHVRDGSIIPVAMIGVNERLGSFKNVPTMNEFGKDPLRECVLRRSVFAPKGIPEERRLLLEKAFIKAQDHSILQARYNSLSLTPAYGDGFEAEKAVLQALMVAREINLKKITKR